MITLRWHHIKALIIFNKKEKYKLSNKEYIKEFQEKNKWYHSDDFVLYWKNFLTNLLSNPELEFKYQDNYKDEACLNCDIIKECKMKNSKLHNLVNKLDSNFNENFPNFKIWNVYKIRDITW